ncbi:hypothetical protein [Paenibacillus xylanivorans]|uniref:Tissue inhibitor of metalloproteinase n=1 Tax=Paenibacillus xylanivorans TaxID=1705561 RepID=A0A0N0C4L4_9BACL|nr:hypothetical protein [Paenibacillus xylanivorans]KOY15967.1 hypothetical protein AMS66_15245 [Paenibacillus xylanivorans]
MKCAVIVTLALLFITAGFLLVPEGRAYACSCVESNAQEKLKTSTSVFTGKVVKRGGVQIFSTDRVRAYTFEVDTAWKGVSSKRMTVLGNDAGSESCGIQLEKNQSYLIFAYQDEEGSKLHTNLCSGNVSVEQAGDALKLLGAGKVLSQDDFGETIHGRSWSSYLMIYGGVVLLIVLVSGWIWRRKKRT